MNPELFAAVEQVAEHSAADLADGGGDDDHGASDADADTAYRYVCGVCP